MDNLVSESEKLTMDFKLRIMAKHRIKEENHKLAEALNKLTPWASDLPIKPLSEKIDGLCKRMIQQAAGCFGDYQHAVEEISRELSLIEVSGS